MHDAMKPLTQSIIEHAHALARENQARAIVVYGEAVGRVKELTDSLRELAFPIVLVVRKGRRVAQADDDTWTTLYVPRIRMDRNAQVKLALLYCLSHGLVDVGDRVVCVSGVDGSGVLDAILLVELASEMELLKDASGQWLSADVQPAVFERVVTIAVELAVEGREGRPVGALFVLGDCDRVLSLSRQMVMNPFQGYEETYRNILDPHLEETIKEFATIDGAFVVRGDGVVLTAGTFLASHEHGEKLAPGLGTRHAAAADITAGSQAVAVVVSESTGTVTLYRGGKTIMEIAKPTSAPGLPS